MSDLTDLLQKQRNARDVYLNGNERIPARDVDVYLLNMDITICQLIKWLAEKDDE